MERLVEQLNEFKDEWADTSALIIDLPCKKPKLASINSIKRTRKSTQSIICVKKVSDPFAIAKKTKDTKTLIINPICTTNRGGGVQNGADTPEADICRRSNFYNGIIQCGNGNIDIGQMIYATDVTALKYGPEYKDCKFKVDILSVAIPKRPQIIYMGPNETYEKPSDQEKTHAIINASLNVAAKYDSVIIDGLGYTDNHPIADYINILSKNLHGIELIYYLLPLTTDNATYKAYYSLDNTGNLLKDLAIEAEFDPTAKVDSDSEIDPDIIDIAKNIDPNIKIVDDDASNYMSNKITKLNKKKVVKKRKDGGH